jgi:hypothetical protein
VKQRTILKKIFSRGYEADQLVEVRMSQIVPGDVYLIVPENFRDRGNGVGQWLVAVEKGQPRPYKKPPARYRVVTANPRSPFERAFARKRRKARRAQMGLSA